MSDETQKKSKEDVLRKDSDKKGILGFFEKMARTFRLATYLGIVVFVIFITIFSIGVALAPGVFLVGRALWYAATQNALWGSIIIGLSLASAYVLYGLTLIFVLPLMNFLIPFKIKPFRGPWQSLDSIGWFIHNSLVQIARYTFLPLITPTPLLNLFYQMMGMKIGKGVIINTTNISDPALITLEDYVVIGGLE